MNVIEKLKELGRALLVIDTSAIRGRVKFNRINRAVADMHYFVLTAEFDKATTKEAHDYLQNLMEHMNSGSWRLQKVVDAVGANL